MRSSVALLSLVPAALPFTPIHLPRKIRSTALSVIGIFYGTSTGSTEEAAHMIAAEFGSDAVGPFEIDTIQGNVGKEFGKYDALVVGTPTWNTGADTERSGTGWDEIYYTEMQNIKPVLEGKKVAVFGLGDSVSYSENYADATGELHDVFESLGSKMLGYTSTEGYIHDASKSQRGNKFIGLLLDAVNQEELTEVRIKKWVASLKDEGIMEGSSDGFAVEVEPLEEGVRVEIPLAVNGEDKIKQSHQLELTSSFKAHYNQRKDKTMWISLDGRSSFVTSGKP